VGVGEKGLFTIDSSPKAAIRNENLVEESTKEETPITKKRLHEKGSNTTKIGDTIRRQAIHSKNHGTNQNFSSFEGRRVKKQPKKPKITTIFQQKDLKTKKAPTKYKKKPCSKLKKRSSKAQIGKGPPKQKQNGARGRGIYEQQGGGVVCCVSARVLGGFYWRGQKKKSNKKCWRGLGGEGVGKGGGCGRVRDFFFTKLLKGAIKRSSATSRIIEQGIRESIRRFHDEGRAQEMRQIACG